MLQQCHVSTGGSPFSHFSEETATVCGASRPCIPVPANGGGSSLHHVPQSAFAFVRPNFDPPTLTLLLVATEDLFRIVADGVSDAVLRPRAPATVALTLLMFFLVVPPLRGAGSYGPFVSVRSRVSFPGGEGRGKLPSTPRRWWN